MRRLSSRQVLPGYVTSEQAAELIGVSQEQVLRYFRGTGLARLPAVRIGRSWLVKLEDVRNFERPPMGNPRNAH